MVRTAWCGGCPYGDSTVRQTQGDGYRSPAAHGGGIGGGRVPRQVEAARVVGRTDVGERGSGSGGPERGRARGGGAWSGHRGLPLQRRRRYGDEDTVRARARGGHREGRRRGRQGRR